MIAINFTIVLTTELTILMILFSSTCKADQSIVKDYFMLNEAKINEIRATEDLHYISQPFYFTYNPEKFQYEIGLPTLKRHDGRVIIPCEKKCIAYYACPLHSENQQTEHKEPKNKLDVSGQDDILLARLVNRNTLYSRGKLNPVRNNYFFAAANDVDAYNNKCESQVRPRIRVAQESGDTATQYEIIFDVFGIQPLVIAEVLFNKETLVPVYTRHTIHGTSLTAAPILFDSRQKFIFNGERAFESLLKRSKESYDYTEVNLSAQFGEINDITSTSTVQLMDFVPAKLIPDYDMVLNSWQDVPQFYVTMAPMWKNLFTGLWCDVESAIREAAFMFQEDLVVYSGVHGTMTTKTGKGVYLLEGDKNPVPDLFWKLVIRKKTFQHIVIIVHNVSRAEIVRGVFTKTKPVCQTLCSKYQWRQFKAYEKYRNFDENIVYCCSAEQFTPTAALIANDIISQQSEILYFPKVN